jgi:hypothetical protein
MSLTTDWQFGWEPTGTRSVNFSFPRRYGKKTKSTCKKGRTRGLVICTQINNTNGEKRNKFITLTDEERPNDP